MKTDIPELMGRCIVCHVEVGRAKACWTISTFRNSIVEVGRADINGFCGGLPHTQRGHDSIWVIMDRLTKSAHFILIKSTYKASQYAPLFIFEIMKVHGVPVGIVLD
jgi:hypothetical protein